MKKFFTSVILTTTLVTLLNADSQPSNIELLAKELNLYAGSKASIQWKRVFSSPRHLKRYKLENLDQHTRDQLEEYLINHAADSEQPIVPGIL
ncbi:hypothetical protein [Sulfurimonas marina]|uniref:Uncharacterized protein n=1 Tax=Sulfurimonas marina TaxID=2590551 RepID=A0A7M1AW90_9BACT|nr:hypothetical protein [Sulfurimonas marina]QOP40642.1 hypothetical protein FJR03_02335 [Sulfurimonas marina]